MVINVEYNQLDPLLRASGYPDGDVNDETGFSPFPGNINQVLIFITYKQFLIHLKFKCIYLYYFIKSKLEMSNLTFYNLIRTR